MIISKKLAETLFHTYNLYYLGNYPNSSDKENYLDSISEYQNTFFHITWSEGGTYGSCWNDDLSESSGEPEPSMKRLIDFLGNIKPSLTKSQYQQVFSKVTYKSIPESDYYGGRTSDGHKNISFDDLIEFLSSLDCYQDDDIVDFDELKEEYSNFIIDCDVNTYYSFLSKRKLHKTLNEDLNLKDDLGYRMKI